MGLMYLFPTEKNESDHIISDSSNKYLKLRSYGLPWIFWGYLAASLIVIFTMMIAIKDPMIKLWQSEDEINIFLVKVVAFTLIATPIGLISFFFFEKEIKRNENIITLTYKIFFIPFFSKKFSIKTPENIIVKHFLDSPNVAKLKRDPNLVGFENRGYFELFVESERGEMIKIDRHSKKGDLEKLKAFLLFE